MYNIHVYQVNSQHKPNSSCLHIHMVIVHVLCVQENFYSIIHVHVYMYYIVNMYMYTYVQYGTVLTQCEFKRNEVVIKVHDAVCVCSERAFIPLAV